MGASSFGRSGSARGSLMHSLGAAAAALSVLALLLSPSSSSSPSPLLVAEAAVVPGPFGDHAVVSAPAGYFASWEGNQLIPDTGFCLSESEGRVLQNWSSPLYQRRIVVAAEGGPGMSMLWAWIVKILLQEVVGHQVWWYDAGASTDTFYNRLVLDAPDRRSDIEIQSYLQPAAPTEDYRAHVTGTGEVVNKGSHSQTNQGGIYLTRSSMEKNPQFAMESWRAFGAGPNVLHEAPLYAPNSTLLQLFRADSWATLDSFRNVWGQDMLKEYTGEFVCQPTMVGRDGRPFETGCTDPDYPSMYFPPQCYPNPREQCALIFATTPVWMGSYMQGQVRSLNLSLGIAFLNVGVFGLEGLVTNADGKHLLMYTDGTQAATNSECVFSGRKLPCWHRMQLPTYTSLCSNTYTGNFSAPYSCDFPSWQQVKYARKDLVIDAPRADFFLQQLDLGPQDTFFFFQQPELSGWPQDHKSVACRWIRQAENRARWQSWIAPPAACTPADTQFLVSECDEKKGVRTITYSWKAPKACVGGWALPQPEELSCGYVTAALSWQVGCVVVAAVLLFIFAGLTAFRAIESCTVHLATRRAAAEAAQARSRAGGKTHIVSIAGGASKPPAVFAAAIELRRHMPIFALCHRSIYPLNLSFVLLLLVPFVQMGTVSESLCWLRYSFTLGGVVFMLEVFATLLVTLTNNLNRSLQSSSTTAVMRAIWATNLVLLVTLLVVAASGGANSLAASATVLAPGGGSVMLDYCSSPVDWMAAVHVTLCCLWGVLITVSLVRVLLRVHLSSLFGAHAYAAYSRQKSGPIKKKDSNSITRAQLVQANSLALAWLVWLVASVLLLLPLYSRVEAKNTESTLLFSSIVVIVATSLCFLALFAPSLWRSRAVRRAAAASTKAAANGGIRMAAMAGAAASPTNVNAQVSTNVSTSSDMLTGDAADEDREVTAVSLASVLRDPVLLLHFRRFAECSFDPEPVHFLLQCQALYRQLKGATLNLTQVLSGLEAICDEFVAEGSPQQVNISSALRDTTLAAVQDVRLTAVAQARNRLKPASAEFKAQARQCLQDAVSEVYSLVQVNSYPRFLNSSALGRSQHLLRWAEGFEELDDDEQAAMMAKLRDAHAQAAAAARRFAEDNNSRNGSGPAQASSGGSGRKAQEAAILAQSVAQSQPLSGAEVVKTRLGLRLSDTALPGSRSGPDPRGSPTLVLQARVSGGGDSPLQRPSANYLNVRVSSVPLDSASASASGAAPHAQPDAHLSIDVLSAHDAAFDSPAASSSLLQDPDSARPPSLPGSTDA